MDKIEIAIPNHENRVMHLTGTIDDEAAERLITRLSEIDAEAYAYTQSNISKLADIGIEVEAVNLPPINLLINSPGGYVYDALAIYDALSKRDDVIAICNGKVMSAATFLLLGVNPENRFATENTTFMIHQPSSITYGKLKDMETDVEETKRLHQVINGIYTSRSGITSELLDNIYRERKDYYFTAKEALKLGLISKII